MDSDIEVWKKLLVNTRRRPPLRLVQAAIDYLSSTSTPVIADAMNGQNVIEDLHPIVTASSITGPAVTVKTDSRDWGTTVTAIEFAKPGDVIVIEAAGAIAAVWGGLASLAAQNQGVVGAIVHGGCRDIDTIRNLEFPLWSKSITPRAGKPLNEGHINVPIHISNVLVKPNDIIKADAIGVVCVPSRIAKQIVIRINEVQERERTIYEGLKKGQKFSDLI